MISSIDKIRMTMENVQSMTGLKPVKAEMSRYTMHGLEFDHITTAGVIGYYVDLQTIIGAPIQRNDAMEKDTLKLIYKSSSYVVDNSGLVNESALVKYVNLND